MLSKSRVGFRNRLIALVRIGGWWSKRSFALNSLDVLLEDRVLGARKYYVELGANDGVSQSNTLRLEILHGWRGALIEPAPSAFKSLVQNRSGRRNYLVRAACVSGSYEADSVSLAYSNLMTAPLNLESDFADPMEQALRGQQFLEKDDRVRIISAPARTLTEILIDAGAPHELGLLSLDVEGAEREVLKGLDFRRFSFEWILVETRNLELTAELIAKHGYKLEEKLTRHDYLFKRG